MKSSHQFRTIGFGRHIVLGGLISPVSLRRSSIKSAPVPGACHRIFPLGTHFKMPPLQLAGENAYESFPERFY